MAFAGGLDVPVVMGSRSTNLKAKIGGIEGRKLGAGDEIGFRSPKTWLPNMAARKLLLPELFSREHTLRVVMGPRTTALQRKGSPRF